MSSNRANVQRTSGTSSSSLPKRKHAVGRKFASFHLSSMASSEEGNKSMEGSHSEKHNDSRRQSTISEEVPDPALAVPEPELAPSGPRKRILLSAILVLLATGASVAESQLAKQSYSDNFNAPFLMMYTSQMVRVLTYPVCLGITILVLLAKKKGVVLKSQFKDGLLVYGPRGPTPTSVFKVTIVLAVSSLVSLGLYMSTLSYVSPSESTTLMTSQVALVYVISIVFLKQRVLVVKVLATVVSFSGVAVTAYVKGFQSDSVTGIVITMVAACFYAVNQVYLKWALQSPKLNQVCLYMSSTALFILVFGWCAPLTLWILGVEMWELNTLPWGWMIGSGSATLATAITVNYGISVATPFFISMYNLLRIPINNLIDAYIRGQQFQDLEIVGAVLIAVGFIFIVLPDEKVSIPLRTCCSYPEKKAKNENEIEMVNKF